MLGIVMEMTIVVMDLMSRLNIVNQKVELVSVIYLHVIMETASQGYTYATVIMIVWIIRMKMRGTSVVSIEFNLILFSQKNRLTIMIGFLFLIF